MKCRIYDTECLNERFCTEASKLYETPTCCAGDESLVPSWIEDLLPAIATLAWNIAVALALSCAFELGRNRKISILTNDLAGPCLPPWSPGCGRAAP